jgi:hypothetical protein
MYFSKIYHERFELIRRGMFKFIKEGNFLQIEILEVHVENESIVDHISLWKILKLEEIVIFRSDDYERNIYTSVDVPSF